MLASPFLLLSSSSLSGSSISTLLYTSSDKPKCCTAACSREALYGCTDHVIKSEAAPRSLEHAALVCGESLSRLSCDLKSHRIFLYMLSRRDVTRSDCRMESAGKKFENRTSRPSFGASKTVFSLHCARWHDRSKCKPKPRRQKQGLSALDGRTVSPAAAATGTGSNMPYTLIFGQTLITEKQVPFSWRFINAHLDDGHPASSLGRSTSNSRHTDWIGSIIPLLPNAAAKGTASQSVHDGHVCNPHENSGR